MQRNKRTEIKGQVRLDTLTERILKQMGKEGAALRQKLSFFYENCLSSKDSSCRDKN